MQLTVEQLEKVCESKDFKILAGNVLIKMAHTQLAREKVDSYSIPLFQSMGFTESMEGHYPGTPIESEKDVYLVYENYECPLYEKYIELLHPLHLSNGFDIKPGHCPALIAEMDLRDAEQHLLAHMSKEIAMPVWRKLEDRKKMLDLYLSIRSTQLSRKRNT
jgi:hypothetical protein